MKIDTKDFKRYVSPVEFYNPPVEAPGNRSSVKFYEEKLKPKIFTISHHHQSRQHWRKQSRNVNVDSFTLNYHR